MSDYETDIVVWSQNQAGLLRRVAAGGPVNGAPEWTDIVEEVESVGTGQVFAVTSLPRQALLPWLEAWPSSRDAPHRQAEARSCRGDAADRFTPSMRQTGSLARLYRRALRGLPETMDGERPLRLPDACPFTLDDLLVHV